MTDGRVNYAEEARTLLASAADIPTLLDAVRDVLALHLRDWSCGNPAHTNPDVGCPDCEEYCTDCGQTWPCATVRALAAHLDLTDPGYIDTDRIRRAVAGEGS